jgi:acetyltransferase-like isoleucine patch superfamily enzyme
VKPPLHGTFAAGRGGISMAYARLVATHVSVISCRRGFSYGAVPVADRDIEFGPMAIWEDARMGRHPVVLPGVRIGRGSIVGPGAALTSDLPPYSVAVGSPARVMRKR